MRIGYARVSTRDQNLEMQFDALARAACPRIFTDKLSGALDDRPGLKEAVLRFVGGEFDYHIGQRLNARQSALIKGKSSLLTKIW